MAKILTFEIPENEYTDFQSFLRECSTDIQVSLKAMEQDKQEIKSSRRESKRIYRNIENVKTQARVYLDDLEKRFPKVA